jgi:hypothetical protein
MSNNEHWGQAIQLDQSTGLWYKFKHNPDGTWEILCSGDKASLDRNSVISHDHYWQKDGRWYFQGKVGNNHTIGRDGFLGDLRDRNQNGNLSLTDEEKCVLGISNNENIVLTESQIKSIADHRANQAYGNSGYVGDNHGIEVSSYDPNGGERMNRLVSQYQQSSAQNLVWRDNPELKMETQAQLNWRDDTSNATSLSSNFKVQSNQRRHESTKGVRK